MSDNLKVGYNVEINTGLLKGKVGRVCVIDKCMLTVGRDVEYVGVDLKGYRRGNSCMNNTKFGKSSGVYINKQYLLPTNKPLTDF